MHAVAIIGANFGDEGKGLMADYFANQSGAVVVRFNGGAQAGHTVVTPDGCRHVFHHFGSGALCGSPTFLSQHFIVNPLLWEKELAQLIEPPALWVDRRAFLTTPFDMLVNQEVERARGANRHGSCGIGINETVERCQSLRTHAGDVECPAHLKEMLAACANWAEQRMEQLGIRPSSMFRDLIGSKSLRTFYLGACERFRRNVSLCDTGILSDSDSLVFEGAQGLLLDETHRFFPHVTRSRTGLCNVAELAKDMGLTELTAVYVTRSYMTRHGAGPFPSEIQGLSFPDETNQPNEWQGSLRFGSLDIPLLAESVSCDLGNANGIDVSPRLAVTCLDQQHIDAEAVAEACQIDLGYVSYGPTRNHVSELIPAR